MKNETNTTTNYAIKQGILRQSTVHTRESGECVTIPVGTPVAVIDSLVVGRVTFLTLESPEGDIFRVQDFKFEECDPVAKNSAALDAAWDRVQDERQRSWESGNITTLKIAISAYKQADTLHSQSLCFFDKFGR
jgi:hypothetical protein